MWNKLYQSKHRQDKHVPGYKWRVTEHEKNRLYMWKYTVRVINKVERKSKDMNMLSTYIWGIHNVDFNKVLTQWTKTVKSRCDKHETKIQSSRGQEHVNVYKTIDANTCKCCYDNNTQFMILASKLRIVCLPSYCRRHRRFGNKQDLQVSWWLFSSPVDRIVWERFVRCMSSYCQFFFLTSWRVFFHTVQTVWKSKLQLRRWDPFAWWGFNRWFQGFFYLHKLWPSPFSL